MPIDLTPRRAARLTRTAGRELLSALAPYGGQHRSRQNAWAGMSRDAARSRAVREADAAMAAAVDTARAREHRRTTGGH